MDLQLCLDFFAVITYISDYYSKDDSGTLHHIKQALKESGNETLKSKLSLVAHTFLTHRQVGECEAFFRILPHLNMKMSNIETVFLPTGFKKNRSTFLKKLTEKEAEHNPNIIEVSDRAGYYVEKPSMLDKFERLDCNMTNVLADLSYVQFGKRYVSSNKEPRKQDLLAETIAKQSNDKNNQKKINSLDFIVTHDLKIKDEVVLLPKVIKLNNLRPGEPKFMRLRSTQVARIHKFNKLKKSS